MTETNKLANSLTLSKFTINKPKEWDINHVELEIKDYDYESTEISIDELKVLHDYIGEILKISKQL